MSNIMSWIDETPDRVIAVSLGTMLLFLILLAISPEDSFFALAFGLLWLLSLVGIPFACARALDHKNRSFWWMVLFFLIPLIGLIVIVALEDKSNEGINELAQLR